MNGVGPRIASLVFSNTAVLGRKGEEVGGRRNNGKQGGELGRIMREIVILQVHYGHLVFSD